MTGSTEIVGQETGKTSLLIRRIVAYVVLAILVFISLLPFYLLFINATRDKTQIGIQWYPGSALIDNFKKLFAPATQTIFGNVYKALLNSFIVSACASVLCVYFSALTAYATHVYHFKLRKFADTFILLIMMVPTQASAIGFYRMMISLNLIDSYIPLIIPAIASPATYYFMKQYMASSLPLEIVEAARIDGCGEFMTFNRIILPIMVPAMATMGIMAVIGSWNNYLTPLMLFTKPDLKTLPMMVQELRGDIYRTEYGSIYLGLTMTALPLLIVYFVFSKYIIAGVALGGVKE